MIVLEAIWAAIKAVFATPQRIFFAAVLLVLALAGGSVLAYRHERDAARAELAQAKKAAAVAKVDAKQADVTAAVVDKAAQAQTQIQTVFRDRIIYRDREVPHEVIVREDAACTITGRFVGMWNSANRAEVPTTAGLLDEAPSGVVLSDVEAQHDREAEAFHANAEQLKALQDWVRQQAAIAKE
jgi:hypothetical protein